MKRALAAGWISGGTTAFGIAAFGWMNPYLALMLTLGGIGLCATAWAALTEESETT